MITLIVAYKNLAVPSTISDEMKARIAQNKRIALAKKQQKLQLPQTSDAQAVQASDAQAVSTLIGSVSCQLLFIRPFFSIISFLSSPLNISFWRHIHLNSSVRIFFFFLYFFLFSFFFFPP